MTVINPRLCRPKRLFAIKTPYSSLLAKPEEANLLTDIADVHRSATTFQENEPKACVETPSHVLPQVTPAASHPSPLSTPSGSVLLHRPPRWYAWPPLKRTGSQRPRRRSDTVVRDDGVNSSISHISFATNGNQPKPTEWKLKMPRLSKSLNSVCLLRGKGGEVEPREEERMFPIEKGS